MYFHTLKLIMEKKEAGQILKGDLKTLARVISIIENESGEYHQLLSGLTINYQVPVIGITGPPGAGKSSLINVLLKKMTAGNPEAKIAVLAIDPTSPFTHGSLLGDRLRMNEHYDNPNIYIRSLATRGSLGGLSAKTLEITDVLRSADFNYILVETVGVGQSEVEIAALADTTIVVLVPESGDDIQTIKSGIMEIADIFVVNKSDREGADKMMKNLMTIVHEHQKTTWNIPVIKTTATQSSGVGELLEKIKAHLTYHHQQDKSSLLAEQAYRIIQQRRMKDVLIEDLRKELKDIMNKKGFNLYSFLQSSFKL